MVGPITLTIATIQRTQCLLYSVLWNYISYLSSIYSTDREAAYVINSILIRYMTFSMEPTRIILFEMVLYIDLSESAIQNTNKGLACEYINMR